MSDVVTAPTLSAETLEHVLGTGDISKLTVPQRVEFYKAACRSLGLNALTRPIRFLSFQGQMQAYFTRDGTDQLRKNNKISLHIVDKHNDGDVYVVTVRARAPDGREDEDIGAVTLGRLAGDSRANALMKCITKGKRRVTLSICGLGWVSEDELDTMPGARTFDAEDTVVDATPRERFNASTPPVSRTEYTTEQWQVWVKKTEDAFRLYRSRAEVEQAATRESIENATQHGPSWVVREVAAILAEAYARFPAATQNDRDDDELPPIVGEDKLASG